MESDIGEGMAVVSDKLFREVMEDTDVKLESRRTHLEKEF